MVESSLPVELDSEADDARRQNRLNLVGVRRVLPAADRLNRVRIADVEHVERWHEADGLHADRTLDVEVEVLVVRQTNVTNRVQQDVDLRHAIDAVRRLNRDLLRISL